MGKITVLMVCMGNICRSPTAEGVLAYLVEQQGLQDRFEIDSAGTHAYHIGDAPDLRAQKAARDRGIELKHLRARKIAAADFEKFDYILVMDQDNYKNVRHMCPAQHLQKVRLLLDYAPQSSVR
jgi:protein-tyrosine phosphatase